MSSRSKWEEMVGKLSLGLKKTKQESKPEEKKKPAIDQVPGDPGSTVGTIREYKKKREQMMSDL